MEENYLTLTGLDFMDYIDKEDFLESVKNRSQVLEIDMNSIS